MRSGKDELNLIEHPFAVMWDKENETAVIHHEWDARHPVTGRALRASWRVEGSPTMGLPKPNDERVYLVLLELTREAHFQNRAVYFTRYDLVKRLGWPHNEKHYQMLYDAFERLKAVNIVAKNAFWEPRAKSFRNVGFSIIDNFDILNEKPGRKSKTAGQAELPMSYFRWNEVLFDSFQAGYMRTLDLGLALSLKGDIALRLYRYLDKKSYDGRRHFEIELESLCERHLGMRAARYPSKHKERLKPAHDELIQHGIITGVTYEPMKSKKAEKVCYAFRAKVPSLSTVPALSTESDPVPTGAGSVVAESTASKSQTLPVAQDEAVPAVDLFQQMLALKISPDVANTLLQAVAAEQLALQLDCLPDRAPNDAAATFVKAARENWSPPAKYVERLEGAERAQKSAAIREAQKRAKAAQQATERREQADQEQEAVALDAMWTKLDARAQEQIEKQVRQKLEVNEFLRARLQAGKLTPDSPDWLNFRRDLLREKLGQIST